MKLTTVERYVKVEQYLRGRQKDKKKKPGHKIKSFSNNESSEYYLYNKAFRNK